MTILRSQIVKYKDSTDGRVGVYWTHLAEFFVRIGQFGIARDVFEEALSVETGGVATARDFAIVFNSYVKFEYAMIDAEQKIIS